MATKKISDLSLRSDFDETCILPVDDAIQTWRTTGEQIKDFVIGEIPNAAAATAAGLMTNAAQTMAGVKTFNDGLILSSTAGQENLGFYDYGSYTDTLNQMNASPPSITVDWIRLGNLVILHITALANTATKTNSNNPESVTGIPTTIRPSATRHAPWWILNNGADRVGQIEVSSGGILTFKVDPAGSAWTAAQARVYPGSIAYKL